MLTEESKKRVKELCDRIAKEPEHTRFLNLLSELNQVLDGTASSNALPEKSKQAGPSRPEPL